MPNVVLVGFTPAKAALLRVEIHSILVSLGKAHNGITTVLEHSDTQWCNRVEPAPYLIVRDSNAEEGGKIANLCVEQLGVDVELEIIVFRSAPRKETPDISIAPTLIPQLYDPITDLEWKEIEKLVHRSRSFHFVAALRKNENAPMRAYGMLKHSHLEALNMKLRKTGIKLRVQSVQKGMHGVTYCEKEYFMARIP